MTRIAVPVMYGHMSNYQDDIKERYTEIFKALSTPKPVAHILYGSPHAAHRAQNAARTWRGVRQCVSELGKGLDIDPSTVSHHIRELRQSGLIRMQRKGKNMLCWVDPETVIATANLLTGFSTSEEFPGGRPSQHRRMQMSEVTSDENGRSCCTTA